MKVRNYYAPEGGKLTVKELKKVLGCLDHIMKTSGYPAQGTFILNYQPAEDEFGARPESKRIVSFEFEDGVKKNFLCQGRDSRVMAEEIIGYASAMSKNTSSAIASFYNSPYYLLLEATGGRFSAVYFADSGAYTYQYVVLCTIAKALTLVYPNDDELQRSWARTFTDAAGYIGVGNLSSIIERHFRATA